MHLLNRTLNQHPVVGSVMFLLYHYGTIQHVQGIVGKEDISWT
ncbi:MAG TPA: hypothetical protein VEI49_10030 [Terriglobales bacterium]|nr:hypothetical protein [Terriglobales bacterium]